MRQLPRLPLIARALAILLCGVLIAHAELFYSTVLSEKEYETFTNEPRMAIVVGINRHHPDSGIPDLRFAVPDAEGVAHILSGTPFGYSVQLLADEFVTREAIFAALRRAIGSMNKKGTLVFYYGGTGYADPAGRQFVTTYDTDVKSLGSSSLAVDDIVGLLGNSGVPHQLVVIDACRNSKGVGSSHRGLAAETPELFLTKTNALAAQTARTHGLHILNAASQDQASYEEPEFGHGVFTHYLMEGLQGKAARSRGLVTVLSLSEYVGKSVRDWTKAHGKLQIPYEAGEAGEDFVVGGKLVAPPAANPAVQPPPDGDKRLLKLEASHAGIASGRGQSYALVIGIDHYADGSISPLSNALSDAHSIAAALKNGYGFETETLDDPGRPGILQAINRYRRTLGAQDSLVIYYAGHGYFDEKVGKAYWVPADAQPDDNTNWIEADAITSNLKAMAAMHVLVISDSCYSGTLAERSGPVPLSKSGAGADRERYLANLEKRKSRLLLASGANEPVLDAGGDGKHSVFATVLLEALDEVPIGKFTAQELFNNYIQERVGGRSKQLPQYSPIRDSGHDGGGFIFERKPAQ
ncbi:MAG TPA: caspase family protein [Bryobacteraceae bacterium]|nr:caspase family protein [Bryobacteraceae bacterium]